MSRWLSMRSKYVCNQARGNAPLVFIALAVGAAVEDNAKQEASHVG